MSAPVASPAFLAAFKDVIGHEGDWDDDPHDTGNWTGGAVNKGWLKGTKYGVSAAAYPNRDIKNLTLQDAQDIYLRDYWTPVRADELPPAIALLVFDTAVNSGVHEAIELLQSAVHAEPDGYFGPATMTAVSDAVHYLGGVPQLVVNILAERLVYDAQMDNWSRYCLGWARRLFSLALEQADMPGASQGTHTP